VIKSAGALLAVVGFVHQMLNIVFSLVRPLAELFIAQITPQRTLQKKLAQFSKEINLRLTACGGCTSSSIRI
jgi:hypothetical protein